MTSPSIVIQNAYHIKLRGEAIDHLRKSQEIVAKSFRSEYLAASLGSFNKFLDEQVKVGTWGTYIEATALAEKYKVNLIVTPVKKNLHQDPICLYRSKSEDAKTVHLYNSDNNHWYVDSQTKGDGNCLYNALAQAFYQLGLINSKAKEIYSDTMQRSSGITNFSIFCSQNFQQVRALQQKIHEAISHAPTPIEIREDFAKEKKRISRLSPKEQKQIADDHALALQLAREEGLSIAAIFPHSHSTPSFS
jgi:hypothetical protein